ncbi:MAG: YraN family protein [Acidimicrobiales bacterium]
MEARPGFRQVLGAQGEQAAADWYVTQGYEIVARNWRCRDGELDLIVRQGRSYVFCEVKARSSEAFGHPLEAVTREKQMRVRRLAARFLEHEAPVHPRQIRFDVASVLSGVLDVTQGAF